MYQIAKILFWEFLQNLPLMAGFGLALTLGQRDQWLLAAGCMAVGGALGTGVIALTESRKVPGHREPWQVMALNFVGMTTLGLAITAYFLASWGNLFIDALIGIAAGMMLGIGQSLAAREPIGWRHCLALAVAFPWPLMGLRGLMRLGLPVAANILILTLLITVVIGLIDYGPWKAQES